MRRFKVKVNDEVFEVEVEEIDGSVVPKVTSVSIPVQSAEAARPVEVKPTVKPPVSVAVPRAPKVSQSAPAQQGGDESAVRAPIPGVVSGIKVSAGASVKKGDVLILLEAMKMQNEILAPFDATVKEVAVTQGASVQTGDVLVRLAR